jgi:hypothetical protein
MVEGQKFLLGPGGPPTGAGAELSEEFNFLPTYHFFDGCLATNRLINDIRRIEVGMLNTYAA